MTKSAPVLGGVNNLIRGQFTKMLFENVAQRELNNLEKANGEVKWMCTSS